MSTHLTPMTVSSSGSTTTGRSTRVSAMLHEASRHKPLSRTLSEGELSVYSSVSSVRDTLASARQTRDNIRKSRASLRALREESRQTLQDAHDLRRQLKRMLVRGGESPLDESGHDSDTSSQPSATEVSDLTFEEDL